MGNSDLPHVCCAKSIVNRLSLIFLIAPFLGCGGGASGAADTPVTGNTPVLVAGMICGYPAGPNSMRGRVLSVADGDTLAIDDGGIRVSVRLDGIDAPELVQSYGQASREWLASRTLNDIVTVTWAKKDGFGRTVGAVFTQDCLYLNLESVGAGASWMYRAYRCELPPVVRAEFERREAFAREARLGLWTDQSPVAPWVFRNGTDPRVPNCRD